MSEFGVVKFPVALTRDEIKAGITRAFVEVDDVATWRVTEAAFAVGDIVSEEVERKRTKISTRPIGAVAYAEPVDNIAEHGLVIRFKTRQGATRELSVPKAVFEDNAALWALLAAQGLQIMVSARNRSALRQYLIECEPEHVIRTYGKPGWHDTEVGPVFALASEIIGDPDGLIQSSSCTPASTSQRGTLEGWKDEVAERALTFPPAAFGLLCCFAPSLIPHVPFSDDGGFHFYGPTSSGKSIFVEVAASAWGPNKAAPNRSPYVQSWNTTANMLEVIAEGHNHLPTCLDELGEATSKAVGKGAYMLSDGQGRKRMSRDGKAQRVRTFRTLVCSSGEISIEDKVGKAGQHLFGGQAIRFCDIDIRHADLFVEDPTTANELKVATAKNYGHAGPLFVEKLRAKLQSETASSAICEDFSAICKRLIGDEADPRKHRAARRFALCELAGDIAKEFDLLPVDLNPSELVTSVFNAWSTDAGATATNDNKTAAKRLMQFIDERAGISIIRVSGKSEEHEPRGRREGWIDEERGHVFLLRNALSDALGDYSIRSFCRAMVERERPILKVESTKQVTRKTIAYTPVNQLTVKRASMPRTYQFRLAELRAYADDATDHTPYQLTEQPRGMNQHVRT